MGARPRYQVFYFGLARALDKGSGVFVSCVPLHVVVVAALGCCWRLPCCVLLHVVVPAALGTLGCCSWLLLWLLLLLLVVALAVLAALLLSPGVVALNALLLLLLRLL